ncbi:hypothetical protein HELRODRAFT_167085 [Helobdella robusta]|uniref:Uncharacterized protein n=1 Tax=Helobdella robusta TaxID=6412 RepID=T1EZ03_HELRO|nr:hypothetical protein HELRODRAFT_167085 [Helobdella robusta]ESO10582.1 hypothetical protein HELRODRAFT_167085 [Helobdella robusta]
MSEEINSDIVDFGEDANDTEEDARVVDSVDLRNEEDDGNKFGEKIPSSLTSETQDLNKNQVKYEDEEDDDYDEENPPEDLPSQWEGDDGLDASELEVERFCQPKEAVLIEDLTEHFRQRRVIVYPLRLSDLSHPIFIECIERSCSFQTNFTLCRRPLQDNEVSFVGLFFSQSLTSEVLSILIQIGGYFIQVNNPRTRGSGWVEINTRGEKFIADWVKMNSTALCQIPTTLKNLITIKNVPEELGSEQIRSSFSNASDVIIAHNKKKSVEKNRLVRTGFLFFDSEIRGLMKMKRRYRIMCQVRGLKTILKDLSVSKNFTDNQVNKINMVISNCRNLILTDNRIRASLGLPLHTFSDLKRIQSVRESIPKEYNWLSTVSGFDNEAGTDRNWKESSVGSNGGVGGGGGGKRRGFGGGGGGSNRRFNDTRKKWNDRRRASPARRDDYRDRPRGGSRLLEATSRVEEIAAKIARITNSMGLPRQQDSNNPQLSSLSSLMKNLSGYDALKAVLSGNAPLPDQGEMGMMGPSWRGPKNDLSEPDASANLNSFAGGGSGSSNLGPAEVMSPMDAPAKKLENANANKGVGSSWQISSQTSSSNSRWITKSNQPVNNPNQPSASTSTPFQTQQQQPPYHQQHLDQQQQQQYYPYDNNYGYNNQYNYGAAGFPPNFGFPGFGGFPNNPPPPPSNKSGWAYNYPQWGNK